MAYTGTVDLISGIRPKNNGDFPLVDAPDVRVTDDERLDDALAATVRFDKEQSLDDNQKKRARDNIGAGEVDPTLSVEGMAADAKVTGDAISGLKDDLSYIHTVTGNQTSSTIVVGTETDHSSTSDRFEFIAKAGAILIVNASVSDGTSLSYQLISDNGRIASLTTNNIDASITLETDINSIGIYVQKQSEEKSLTVHIKQVGQIDSILEEIDQIESNANDVEQKLVYFGYNVKTIEMKSSVVHSSQEDLIDFAILSGNKIIITAHPNAESASEFIVIRVFGYQKGSSTAVAISGPINLYFDVPSELESNGTYDYIGLYWAGNWNSYAGTITFKIDSENSIFTSVNKNTENIIENQSRLDKIENLELTTIPYSTEASSWHSGTINQTTGENSGSSSLRIRYNSFIELPNIENIDLTTAELVNCALYFYTDSNIESYITDAGWTNWQTTGKIPVPSAARYFRISLKYSTENTQISKDDVANGLFTLAYGTPIVDATTKIDAIPSYLYDTYDLTGSIDISAIKTAFSEFVNTYGSDDGESFAFITDPHPYYVEDTSLIEKFYASISLMCSQIPMSFMISGGDWLTSDMTKAVACENLGYITSVMKRITNGQFYPLLGNHDLNIFGTGENPALSYGAIVNTMFPDQGRAYYHFNGNNTSFYAIDTGSDKDTVIDEYRTRQLSWLAESLVNDEHQHIAITEHIYCVNTINNVYTVAAIVNQIITAYNNRSTYTFNNKTYDYSNAVGHVEFIIAGHAHKELDGYINGIPVIICDRAFTATMIGMDYVIVDYTTRTINVLRTNTRIVRSYPLDEV